MKHVIVLFAFLFLFCLSVSAQDQAEKPTDNRLAVEQVDKDRDVYKGLTIGKKFTGRLPSGYREVVSNSQREEIYKIQKEYFEVLEMLKLRIEQLESERNRKIDGLLTEEQRTKLKSGVRTSARPVRNTPARNTRNNQPATEPATEPIQSSGGAVN